MKKEIAETLITQKPERTLRRALQVWFRPQDLLDLAAVVSVALESRAFRQQLQRDFGVSVTQLAELAEKMNKEVQRV